MRALGQLVGQGFLGLTVVCFGLNVLIPYPALAAATPMVAITRPDSGASVGAEVWVDASYQSASKRPIVRLELLVDEQIVRTYVLPTPKEKGEQSFAYTFQSPAGEAHKLSVRAVDSAGAMGTATIGVSVRKLLPSPGEDATPPVVNIYYPRPGERVAGTTEVKANAQDNVGVEWVFFYLDGRIKAIVKGAPPFNDRWDTTRVADGEHVLTAKAWDAAENEGRSAEVKVIVGNREATTIQAPPPAPAAVPTAQPALVAPAAVAREAVLVLPVPAPVARSAQAAAQPEVSTGATVGRPQQSGATAPAAQPAVSAARGVALAALPQRSAPVMASADPAGAALALGAPAAASSSLLAALPGAAAVPAPATAAQKPLRMAYAPAPVTQAATVLGAATAALAPVEARAAGSALSLRASAAPAGRLSSAPTARTTARASVGPARAPVAGLAGETALARRAPEVYLLAMLPEARGPSAHEVRGTTPGSRQGEDGRGTVVPLALSRFRDVQVVFDGKVVPLSSCPEVCRGIPAGPLREIFAQADGVLYWFPAEKRVHGQGPTVSLDLHIGATKATVNGQGRDLELAPYIKRGHTMVPLSFLADTMNLRFSFDSSRGQLIVSRKDL